MTKTNDLLNFHYRFFNLNCCNAKSESAEEIVENISGVTENYIERHEEPTGLFSILTYVPGGISP